LAALTFKDWGLSTPRALHEIAKQNSASKPSGRGIEIWGSGGIRNGLHGAKCLALGAQRVGLARPFLEKALEGTAAVQEFMAQLEYELKISLFCSGIKNISELRQRKVYVWETE
jgi:isopentenyl-diphosphate delta-isomerase